MRLKLFSINIGALLVIWAILLSLVYSMMASELYNVLDNQLQRAAERIIHVDIRNQAKPSNTQSPTISGIGYSLWSLVDETGTKTSFFIDGNPFVNVWQIYNLAVAHPNGYYVTVRDAGVPYRSFYALVHAQKGNYLIRVTTPTGPTDTTLGNLLWTLTEVGLAALALTIAVGMWLAARSLAPTIAAWRRQQQFVADASHELRTPLTIIKTNLEVLLQNPDHTIESEMRYLGNAYEELVRTGSLI
ncbi:MAG: histidine kinase dimerization/phospho-acceptor domain-containing protein, partial [Bacilli bacterium]